MCHGFDAYNRVFRLPMRNDGMSNAIEERACLKPWCAFTRSTNQGPLVVASTTNIKAMLNISTIIYFSDHMSLFQRSQTPCSCVSLQTLRKQKPSPLSIIVNTSSLYDTWQRKQRSADSEYIQSLVYRHLAHID